MRAEAAKLLAGSLLLGIAYALVSRHDLAPVYVAVAVAESAGYAGLVLWTFRPAGSMAALGVVVLAAIVHVVLIYIGPFAAIPLALADRLAVSERLGVLLLHAWTAGIAAFLLCAILDFVGRLPRITGVTYAWAVAITPLSALPLLATQGNVLAAHKTLWWLLMSIALLVSARPTQD